MATPLIGWQTVKTIYGRFTGVAETEAIDKRIGQSLPTESGKNKVLTPQEYVQTFIPHIDGMQHTAVRYDGLTQPTKVPLPAACITMESKGCKCFSQDGNLKSPRKPEPPGSREFPQQESLREEIQIQ